MKVKELFEAPIVIKSKDDPKVVEWIKKVHAKYPKSPFNNRQSVMVWDDGAGDQEIAFFELEPSSIKSGAAEIKWLQASPHRKGVGTRALEALKKDAKEAGISLTLFPWDRGRISQAALMKFYKRSGFKPTSKGSKNMVWDHEE
jgi:hypothetical protein